MRLTRALRRAIWTVESGTGPAVHAPGVSARLTVVVAFSHPSRMHHADATARHLLRCSFIERILFSNHNPRVSLSSMIRVIDPRLMISEEPEERGCGYRWEVARRRGADYVMVLDDDVLIRPQQVKMLFLALLNEPGRVHGVRGLMATGDGFVPVARQSCDVDLLCELYAVTASHLDRYAARRAQLSGPVLQLVDQNNDFVLISTCGSASPRIVDVGRLLLAETFKTPGVAVHMRDGFWQETALVASVLHPGASARRQL